VLLLIVSPAAIKGVVRTLTEGELSEDPHDLIATRLLHTAGGLTGVGLTFGAVYLLLHGVVKVTLVIALLRNKLWAYPWMIAMLLAFIAYQGYLIVLGPSPGLIALTIFDVLIVVLTWREYRKQRGIRSADDRFGRLVSETTPCHAVARGGVGGVDRGGRLRGPSGACGTRCRSARDE